jgi:flagellar basal-body rod protein FlgB
LNYQQAQFGKESARYTATLQFLENRIGGIKRALRGE